MTDTAVQALAFGEILFDVFDDGAYLGGAPLNFAWYLRQFGIPVGMVSAVGQDTLGMQARHALQEAGIAQTYVAASARPTGTVDVKLTHGQPQYTINEGVAWDEIPFPTALRDAPDLLYYGTLAQRTDANRATLAQLLALNPTQRFFDINLRQHYFTDGMVLAGLRAATIAKLNEDEWLVLQRMCGAGDPQNVVEQFGLKALVVTRGDKGASLYVAGHGYHAASLAVTVVDTVGAGDAFSAAIAAATVRRVPLEQALPVACEAGAFVVTQRGAQASLPEALRLAFTSA